MDADVEILEHKRQKQDMEAIYILAPLPYIVDCIMADFEKRRYRGVRLLWTSSRHHTTAIHGQS